MATSSFLLPYQQRVLEEVSIALKQIARGGNSQGMALYGPSGTGKTTTLDHLASSYKNYQDGYQRRVPLCRVPVLSRGDAYSIATTLLGQLGKPIGRARRLKLTEIEPLVHDALITCGTLIIILEELGNALLKSTAQLRGELSRFLKNLWNLHPLDRSDGWAQPDQARGDHRVVLIASGTTDILDALDKDPELGSRFSCRIEAEQVKFYPPDSFRNFRKVAFEMAQRFGISMLFDPNDDQTAARLLLGCASHLRKLESVLSRAVTIHDMNSAMDRRDVLTQAFDLAGGSTSEGANPFRITDAEVAARVAILQRLAGAPRQV
jgi:DNA polymerase III delta prime subunit